MLISVCSQGIHQQDLFTSPDSIKGNSVLMSLLDQINEQHPNSLYSGSKRTVQDWGIKRSSATVSYTLGEIE